MLRQSVDFDWQIGDDVSWMARELPGATPGSAPRLTETQLVQALLRGIALLVFGLCTVNSTPLSATLLAHQRAAEGVQFALQQEKLIHDTGDVAHFSALIDGNVAGQWRRTWRAAWENSLRDERNFGVTLVAVTAQNELAIATVRVTDPAPDWGNVSVYREQRYYRRRGQVWLRTVPPAIFWGDVHYAETAHFRLEYYEPDAAAALAVSAQIEPIYTELHRRLGIVIPDQKKIETIAIVPEMIRDWLSYDNRVEITSPTLAQVPLPLTDEAYLLQLIAGRLCRQAVDEAMARNRTGTEYRWNLLLWGVRSWLLHELTAQRTPWSIEAESALQKILINRPVVELDLVNRWYNTEQPDPTEVMARYLLAESVAHYAFTTYGVERLPILLRNLGVSPTWKDLVPHTFGVPLPEFEAGWQAYVRQTYGAGPKESSQ